MLQNIKNSLETLSSMGLSCVSIEVPADVLGQLSALEGVALNPHDSHLFIFKDAAGEILSVQNLPR